MLQSQSVVRPRKTPRQAALPQSQDSDLDTVLTVSNNDFRLSTQSCVRLFYSRSDHCEKDRKTFHGHWVRIISRSLEEADDGKGRRDGWGNISVLVA